MSRPPRLSKHFTMFLNEVLAKIAALRHGHPPNLAIAQLQPQLQPLTPFRTPTHAPDPPTPPFTSVNNNQQPLPSPSLLSANNSHRHSQHHIVDTPQDPYFGVDYYHPLTLVHWLTSWLV